MPTEEFPLVDAGDIRRFAGPSSFERGRLYARDEAVLTLEWHREQGRLIAEVQGSTAQPYDCSIDLVPGAPGYHRIAAAICSCPIGGDCKHVVAALLRSNAEHARAAAATTVAAHTKAGPRSTDKATAPPSWKSTLEALATPPGPAGASGALGSGGGPPRYAPLGIQFEVRERSRRSRGRWYGSASTTTVATPETRVSSLRIAMRPVTLSDAGRWVIGGLSWSTMQYQLNRLSLDDRQVRWFGQFAALARAQTNVYLMGTDAERILLDDFASPLLWVMLDEARRLGISLVGAKRNAPVVVAGDASITLEAVRNDEGTGTSDHLGLTLRPSVHFDDDPIDPSLVSPIGDHGLYSVRWSNPSGNGAPVPTLTMARAERPVTDEQLHLLRAAPIEVPADDVGEFLTDFYPALNKLAPVQSTDASLRLPEIAPPTLVLTATFEPEHVLRLGWDWEYRAGDHVTRRPLGSDATGRGPGSEAATLHAVHTALDTTAAAVAPASTPTTLTGLGAAEFTEHALPVLEALPGVRVDVVGERPEYRELHEQPTLRVSTVETDQRDWFDLGVLVHVEGRTVPFAPLFAALATGQRKLLLVDHTYLSLNPPVCDRLRDLIAEAQSLAEWETGPRISRHQAGLWAEFEDLADESEQAVSWRASVGGLLELMSTDARPEPPPLPPGLHADLRPYQHEGFAWLAFLWQHGLGGVLADDMGLGKTLQTLTLIAHARSTGPDDRETRHGGPDSHAAGRVASACGRVARAASVPRPERIETTHVGLEDSSAGLDTLTPRHSTGGTQPPFLVVAPTSVVANWVTEAERFTPRLSAVAVTATSAKAGRTLGSIANDADIVITSYTLFRLDFDEYSALPWAGLILDEAQFVKNHAARAHQCARDLQAPFKLAITGTPMENNLMELWSMFDIVAPGLFPSSRRFTEQYVKPIANAASPAQATPAAHGAEVLARLRRRIRPLMMRRTKELVAPELPAKQEQVLQIELAPRHRRLYDTVLQRERQKLLGLIDDLDKNRFIVFRSLTLLRMLSLDASLIDEAHASVPSSKLDALFEQLEDVLAEGHRALIFSQFTTFLRKAADRLEERGVEYAYLDGSTTRRASVIKKFKDGNAPVFLVSLKAGGFGLNLTEADYVFLLDPWWNPATEAQAIDRTHRIGQTKNVMVYRLVATGTIEEKVMALKAQKARLFDAVLDADAAFGSALTADDIRALLD